MLRESMLGAARAVSGEEFDLFGWTCGRAAVLSLHVIEGDLLGALTRSEESWEVVLVFEGRSAG